MSTASPAIDVLRVESIATALAHRADAADAATARAAADLLADLDARADREDDAADLAARVHHKRQETSWSLGDLQGRMWIGDDGTILARPGSDHAPEPTEHVAWCGQCADALAAATADRDAAADRAARLAALAAVRAARRPCPHGRTAARGAELPAPLDGPGAATVPTSDAAAYAAAARVARTAPPADLAADARQYAARRTAAAIAARQTRADLDAATAAHAAATADALAADDGRHAYALDVLAHARRTHRIAARLVSRVIAADATGADLDAARLNLDAARTARADAARTVARIAARRTARAAALPTARKVAAARRADDLARRRVTRWANKVATSRAALDAATGYAAAATAYRWAAHRPGRPDKGIGGAPKVDQTPPATARRRTPPRITAARADAACYVYRADGPLSLLTTPADRARIDAARMAGADALALDARRIARGKRGDVTPAIRRRAGAAVLDATGRTYSTGADLLARIDAAAIRVHAPNLAAVTPARRALDAARSRAAATARPARYARAALTSDAAHARHRADLDAAPVARLTLGRLSAAWVARSRATVLGVHLDAATDHYAAHRAAAAILDALPTGADLDALDALDAADLDAAHAHAAANVATAHAHRADVVAATAPRPRRHLARSHVATLNAGGGERKGRQSRAAILAATADARAARRRPDAAATAAARAALDAGVIGGDTPRRRRPAAVTSI